ncbi:hypothetical protein LG307_14855 [Sutcliffiella horikoshii]|uniref:hypothetical protein n=1 Tax=Sutcliffiella horikoshii TaxID=79883 RepID=UPI00384F2BDA
MLMVFLRVAFILVGLIFLSEIPTTEKVFFNARFAFYGMVLLDFINVYKSSENFEKHYAGFGLSFTAIITFIDFLGVIDIIMLKEGMIIPNVKYRLIEWVPSIPVDGYIISFSFFTVFFSAAELVLVYVRNKSSKKAVPKQTAFDT